MAYSINGVEIENTFAEAFDMWGSRVIITAVNRKWAIEAASKMTGFATSVIRCHCEGAVEAELERTPDQRPGVSVLFFGFSKKSLAQQLIDRIGQCVLTCPTTACFNGLDADSHPCCISLVEMHYSVNEIAEFMNPSFKNSF